MLLGAGLIWGCATSSVRPIQDELEADRPAEAIVKAEAALAEQPDDFEVRMLLGEAHYRLARKGLDENDEPTYAAHIQKAMDAFVEGARLQPESPSPHLWMGIISVYRSDMRSALDSFRNARRLDPRHPVHYTNLAQIYIYLDRLSRARAMLDRARKLNAPAVWVELNETLAAWKEGDLVEARDIFDTAYGLNPKFVQTWDEAPVDEPIESFEGFVSYCCGNPTCGPYMRGPCERMEIEVKERELQLETLRKEREAEMNRRRALREIYERRRDLQIEVEEPEETPAPE
jgi:cytochrome c-type biogenesis protein CcmH/NrfG